MSPRNGSCLAEISSVKSLSSDDMSGARSSSVSKKKSCWARATDPAHRRGRRIQLLQMLILPFIPILALIVQTASTLHDILIYRQEVSDIESQVGGELKYSTRARFTPQRAVSANTLDATPVHTQGVRFQLNACLAGGRCTCELGRERGGKAL